MAMRSQQFPGLDAKGATEALQFVDACRYRSAADAIQRAIGHAAGRRDLG
jgi:hypothetical protein